MVMMFKHSTIFLKPINYGTINNCLDKFIHLFSREFYYYHKGNDIISIPYNDIMYIEKNGHDVILHTTSNVFVERISLNEISKRLPVFFYSSSQILYC